MGEEGSRSFQKTKNPHLLETTRRRQARRRRGGGDGVCVGCCHAKATVWVRMAKDRPNPAGLLSPALYRNLRAGAEVGDGVLEPPVAPHTPDA